LSWLGSDPKLPSILLNSHTDVVPVVEANWKHDAFAAIKDSEGNIFARGTQDMKSVSIQYLEAIAKLKKSGVKPLRTVHLSFVPDEEISGADGMFPFVNSKHFEELNVGVALDEGLASPDDSFTVFYGERVPWWVKIKATGPTGHGSRFVENTAMEKLLRVVDKLLTFRKQQFNELQRGMAQCGMKLGDVTTINLTMLKGGVTTDGEVYSLNVIPSEAEAGFDIRIPPSVDLQEFSKQLAVWTSEEGVSCLFYQQAMTNPQTPITDDNKWWGIFKHSLEQMGCKLDPQIFPAATDSRYLRDKGIPAFGFSPMNHTPILLHDHNEFLNEKIYLKGIDIFCGLISALANVQS